MRQEDSDTDDDGSWKEVVKEAADEEMRADEMLGMPLVISGAHVFRIPCLAKNLCGFKWEEFRDL